MGKLPAFQFYPGDWLRDPVSGCSLMAQGLWLRMMILAHDAENYGYLQLNGRPIPPEQIAKRSGCDTLAEYLALLAELDNAGVPARTPNGTLYSRRMVRDHKLREDAKRYGKLGGNPTLKPPPNRGDNGGVNPPLKMKGKMKMKMKLKGVPEKTEDFNCNSSLSPSTPGHSNREKAASEPAAATLRPADSVEPADFAEPADSVEPVEFFELIPAALRVPAFLDAWQSWVADRRARRKPYTEQAAVRALPKLAAEGVSAAVERIDRSITNGWQGLFFSGEPAPGSVAGPRTSSRPTARDERHRQIKAALEAT